jgi:hypothetical protein
MSSPSADACARRLPERSSVPLQLILHPRESRSEGDGGGGGRRIDRAEPHAGPHAALREPQADLRADLDAAAQTCTQARIRLPRLRRAACAWRGFPPPRLWKLTGCGKLRTTSHPPPDLPTTVGNPGPRPPPGIPTATHSLDGQDRDRGRRQNILELQFIYIYDLMVGRPPLPPAPLQHHQHRGRHRPHPGADANSPSLGRPVIADGNLPHPDADAHAPAHVAGRR